MNCSHAYPCRPCLKAALWTSATGMALWNAPVCHRRRWIVTDCWQQRGCWPRRRRRHLKLRLGDSSTSQTWSPSWKNVFFFFGGGGLNMGYTSTPPKAIWNMDKDDELHFLVLYFQINPPGLPFSVTVKLHFSCTPHCSREGETTGFPWRQGSQSTHSIPSWMKCVKFLIHAQYCWSLLHLLLIPFMTDYLFHLWLMMKLTCFPVEKKAFLPCPQAGLAHPRMPRRQQLRLWSIPGYPDIFAWKTHRIFRNQHLGEIPWAPSWLQHCMSWWGDFF